MISLEYIAGFFDGEGSIGIYKNGRGLYHLRTQLTQNANSDTTPIIEALRAQYGGNVCRLEKKSNRPKTIYNWQLNGHGALRFLRELEPHLIVKKRQATIAIEWQSKKLPTPERDALGRIKSLPATEEDIETAALLKKLKE